MDDYYYNVVDWGADNLLGVGLGYCLYTWEFKTNKVEQMTSVNKHSQITNVTFDKIGNNLVFGQTTGRCCILDVRRKKVLRSFSNHN